MQYGIILGGWTQGVILSEVSQTEGETLYDTPYMWNQKRNYTNELIYKTKGLTDLENELTVAGGRYT